MYRNTIKKNPNCGSKYTKLNRKASALRRTHLDLAVSSGNMERRVATVDSRVVHQSWVSPKQSPNSFEVSILNSTEEEATLIGIAPSAAHSLTHPSAKKEASNAINKVHIKVTVWDNGKVTTDDERKEIGGVPSWKRKM